MFIETIQYAAALRQEGNVDAPAFSLLASANSMGNS